MRTLILGANAGIAKSIAKELNGKHELILASRNTNELNNYINEQQIKAEVVVFDALDYASHQDFSNTYKDIDQVICVFGILGDHEKAKSDFSEAKMIIETNYNSAISILDQFALIFEKRESGSIVGISSVAADRGRQSNYYYGSAKAGFEAYLSGLRNRLFSSKVHVLTVKPGFVKTKMIVGMETPSILTATPKYAAKRIIKASKNKRNIIYISWKWYWVMGIIKAIPEFMFKRLKL